MKTQQYRQGDVLIERVAELPKNIKPVQEKRVILAHGEVTGHAHEMATPELATIADVKEAWRLPGDLPDADPMTRHALKLKRRDLLRHQEHREIALQRGNHRVTRQREYSPEVIRNVTD